MVDVSIIIISYNTRELTLKCLKAVYTFTKNVSFEVILVDNNSSDQSAEAVSTCFPNVKLIVNSKNVGFGTGNNIGAKVAIGKYLFLLNSDAFLLSDASKSFFDFMNQPENATVGVVGGELSTGKDYDTVSFGNLPSVFEYFSYLGFKNLYRQYFNRKLASGLVNKSSEIREVGYINGANMFIRRTVFEEVKGFDEDFFLYFEETELSFRIKKLGYKSMLVPSVKIIHLVSFFRDKSAPFNYKKLEVYSKSRFMYFKKCKGLTSAYLTNFFTAAVYVIQGMLGKEQGNFWKKAYICLTSHS